MFELGVVQFLRETLMGMHAGGMKWKNHKCFSGARFDVHSSVPDLVLSFTVSKANIVYSRLSASAVHLT